MPSFPPISHRLFLLSAMLLLLAAASLSIDLAVAEQWKDYPQKGLLYSASILSECFGHGLGVAWIMVTVATLDPRHRLEATSLAVLAFGGGLFSNLFKLLLPRWRPLQFPGGKSVWETFSGWPFVASDSPFGRLGYQTHSFPSAHTATAVGLAIGLSVLYPRGRWLFVVGVILLALQRQAVRAHFTSDTLAGAAIGCLWGAIWLHPRLLGPELNAQFRRQTSASAMSASEVPSP